MKNNGLFSQAGWSLAAQMGYYGLQWLNMIVLARLSGPEAVGLYTLGLAIANPAMAVASLMFRLVYITDQENRWSFEDYNRVRWISLPLGALAIGAIGLGLGYSDLALIVILLAASWKMAEMLSDINYAIPHKTGDMRAIALSMIFRAVLSSAILTLVLKGTNRLDLALFAFSASWWACYLLYDRRFEKTAEEKKGTASRLALVRFSMPMALSASVVYFTFSVPRVALDQYENTETLGIFAAIGHLLLIGALVVNSFGATITPRLSRYFSAGQSGGYYREIALSAAVALFLSLCFIGVSVLAGDRLMTLIYGEAMRGQGGLLVAISLASLPVYLGSILGFVPPALQAYRFHLAVNVVTVAGTAAAAFYFIPVHGTLGAIYAIATQGILQLLNGLILFRKPGTAPGRPQNSPSGHTAQARNP